MKALAGRILAEEGGLKLANLVTLSRAILIVPILLLLLRGLTGAAIALYLVASATDMVDGWLARHSQRASEFGAQLDALVDNLFSLSILVFLTLDYPELLAAHGLALTVLFGGPLAYLAVSWLLTGRLLMFHFWSAKAGALLLFALWPLLFVTGWEGFVPIAAAIVGFSRLEQIVFILRGGVDQDAPHALAYIGARNRDLPARPASGSPVATGTGPSPIRWGAPTARERGPIVTGSGAERNAIGVHAGMFAPYRALAAAGGALDPDHRPDLADTQPTVGIGPFPQWFDAGKIVTFDPWGHRVAEDFAEEIAAGLDVRPSIAITDGRLQMAEIREALEAGRLRADGTILSAAGAIQVTKIAIEPIWWLPGIAHRLGLGEDAIRHALAACSGGMYPELITRPEFKLFMPPIGGASVYVFGNPVLLGDGATSTTCRIHDECNGSDVFGSDLCTCRPYLSFAVEECVRSAQDAGLGVIVYNRKEGRALGEVVKYLVYNARNRSQDGDRAQDYFLRTQKVAGVQDVRHQQLSVDVLHWLGIGRVDRWLSMSNLKRDALAAGGIDIVNQVEIPEHLVSHAARVEITAKKAAGYFSGVG